MITTFLNIAVLCLVFFDAVQFAVRGEFTLFPAMNTVRYESVDEAWNYVESLPVWGEGIFLQMVALPFFEYFSISNAILALIAKHFGWLREKWVFRAVLIVGGIAVALYVVYRFSIHGCAAESYIRKMLI